jgi:hypothetical protein
MTLRPRPRGAFAVAIALAVGLLVLGAAPRPAGAQGTDDDHGAGAFSVDRTVALGIILTGGVGWVLSEGVFKDELAPSACRWCEPNALDEGVRDALLWERVGAARRGSDVAAFVVAPLVGFGLVSGIAWQDGASRSQRIDDALIVGEAMMTAVLVNHVTKLLVGRARPFVYHRDPSDPSADDSDDNLSFYSGHTSFTFSPSPAAPWPRCAAMMGRPGCGAWAWAPR